MACLFHGFFGPFLARVTPGALVSFFAPRVSDLDEFFSGRELEDTDEGEGMAVRDTIYIRISVGFVSITI